MNTKKEDTMVLTDINDSKTETFKNFQNAIKSRLIRN